MLLNRLHEFRLATLLPMLILGASSSAEPAKRLVNGNWYDGGGFVQREFYTVEGTLHESYDGDTDVIDLDGAWVVPAFGNAHTHGIGNDDINRESAHFLRLGVYYVANPNSIGSKTKESREATAGVETVDARFANGGLTCSGGHPIQIFEQDPSAPAMENDAYFVVDDAEMLEKRWPKILEGKPDFLKIYLENSEFHAERFVDPAWHGKRGLDPRLVPLIVHRAHEDGLRVAAHVTSRYDFRIAVDAGVDEIAHLPLETLDAEDARRAASQGTVVVTTALSHRPADGVGDLDALHRTNLATLRNAGVAMVLGTDSHASVIDELKKLDALGVIPRAELLSMLVHDTPRWVFPDRNIGQLVSGAEANFLVLEENPLERLAALGAIEMRFKAGNRIALDESQLDELPGVGQQLVHTIMSRGIDAAIAEYHRMRAEEMNDWDFGEGQLNALGYALIQHSKLVEATTIFQLNCEQFPESSNAWDSLGDSWLKRSERGEAIACFEKALTLDPENQITRDKLSALAEE